MCSTPNFKTRGFTSEASENSQINLKQNGKPADLLVNQREIRRLTCKATENARIY
jgi:hypothetical protein